VLVTSGWHAGRAAALLRGALRGSGSTVELATTDETPSLRARFRELVCWALVPLAAVAARAQLLAGWSGCSGCSGWSVLDADGGASADGGGGAAAWPPPGGAGRGGARGAHGVAGGGGGRASPVPPSSWDDGGPSREPTSPARPSACRDAWSTS